MSKLLQVFQSLSLKKKNLINAIAGSLFLIVIGAINYFALSDVSEKYRHVSSTDLPQIRHLAEMKASFRQFNADMRGLALENLSDDEKNALYKALGEEIVNFEKARDEFQKIPFADGQEEPFNVVKKNWEELKQLGQKAISLSKEDKAEARAQVKFVLFFAAPDNVEALNNKIGKMVEIQSLQADNWIEKALTSEKRSKAVSFFVTLFGFLTSLIGGYILATRLSNELTSIADRIAMAESQVNSASTQLSVSSQQIASGASQTAASLEESVASVEELSRMVESNAKNASEASSLSQGGHASAADGEKKITKLIHAMNAVAVSSKKIEEIIQVIDDIAFQTNLLALNAAVESARAGEQGKGFAVVAEAVRGLAQRSASAAKDISLLIRESVEQTDLGASVAGESGEVLRVIVGSVEKVATLNSEISEASNQQSDGIKQISLTINQLDQTAQSNAAAAEEAAASSEQLSSQAEILKKLVSQLSQVIHGRN